MMYGIIGKTLVMRRDHQTMALIHSFEAVEAEKPRRILSIETHLDEDPT
jgi:hypothetical protein